MQADPLYPDRSLPALFERSVRLHRDRVAVSSDSGELTYAELNAFANRLAYRLLAAGVSRGDRAAVLMDQDLASFASVLAILKAGRVVFILNPADPPARHAELIGDAEPSVLLTDRANADIAVRLAGGRMTVLRVDDGMPAMPAADPEDLARPGDLATLTYTSGTTGRPKGVMQTHGQTMRNGLGNVRRLGITAEDRVLLIASLWGGQANNTTWAAFSSGARLVSFPASVNGVTGLAERIIRHRITIYASASSLFRHFMKSVGEADIFTDVRRVRLSSDAATSEDFGAVRRHFPNARLVSAAGMSEVGIFADLEVSPDAKIPPGRLPVGRPAEGVTVRIVDEDGSEVPAGATGGIVLCARHMSLGYWRDPELTSRHFAVDGDGMRLFRSGDLGRLDENGMLVLVGRKDATVKVRGQRVDLAEVERMLSALPGVAAAAAAAITRANGEVELVAYVESVPAEGPSTRQLRTLARGVMPRHLVPSRFILVDRMPRAANGKIDRTFLRSLAPPRPPAAEPATTSTERMLARIWEEAFDLDGIGRSDDFFELGGESLIAAVIAARVHAAVNVELNFGSFVDHPALSDMAEFIDRARAVGGGDDEVPLVATDRSRPLPLSLLQNIHWKPGLAPHNAIRYTRAGFVRVEGRLDVTLFLESVADVVARQEILRTRFAVVDGEPVQIVEASGPADDPLVDWSETADAEQRAAALVESEARRVFDVTLGPPVRFSLVRTAADVHWFIVSAHNIITDAFSWNILVDDLAAAYEARATGDPSDRPLLPIQFGDFSVWQGHVWRKDGPRLNATLAWWRKVFAAGLVPTQLPLRSRALRKPFSLSECAVLWGLEPATSKRLDELSHREGATFYMVRLAGAAAALAALTGRDDVVIGGIFTNRNRLAYERMFGVFANLVTIAVRTELGESYRGLIARIRDHIAALQANAEIPYERLVEEMAAEGVAVPRLSVGVHIRTPHPPVRAAGLQLSWTSATSRMPRALVVGFDQYAEATNCYIEFDARLYDGDVIDGLRSSLVRFFDAAAADPDLTIGALLQHAGIRPIGT